MRKGTVHPTLTHAMQSKLKNTRTWNFFVLAILALGIAVFAWGLKYKISVYDSALPSSNHVVLAKMLSNRERTADIVALIEQATTPSPILVCIAIMLFTGFLLDAKRQSRWTLQRAQNPQRRVLPQATRQIFFRPPPRRK